jgi:hypothetical protein
MSRSVKGSKLFGFQYRGRRFQCAGHWVGRMAKRWTSRHERRQVKREVVREEESG